MIDEYLNYIQEETFEPDASTKSGTVKNNVRIRKKGNRQEVQLDAALASIKASVGTKDLDESLIGDENDVEYRLDVAAGIIMKIDENNREQVLLIQRAKNDHWPNVWEFPRGKCDKPVGESLFHCAAREIREETGLDIIPIRRIYTYEYIADRGKRKTICHVFLCKLKDLDQKVKLSKEHQRFQWVGEVGEVEMMLMPDQKKILQKFLNRDRTIVSYPDDGKIQQVDESRWMKLLQQGKLPASAVRRIQQYVGKADPLYVKQLLKQGKHKQANQYLKKKGIVKPARLWFARFDKGSNAIIKKYNIKVLHKRFGKEVKDMEAAAWNVRPIWGGRAKIATPRTNVGGKKRGTHIMTKRHEADEIRSKRLGKFKRPVTLRMSSTRGPHNADEVLSRELEALRVVQALYPKKIADLKQLKQLRKLSGEYKAVLGKTRKEVTKTDIKNVKRIEKNLNTARAALRATIKSKIPFLRKKLTKREKRLVVNRSLSKAGLPTLDPI